jgi:hypothetical protein
MIIALNECLDFSRHELHHSFFTKSIIPRQQPIRQTWYNSEYHREKREAN